MQCKNCGAEWDAQSRYCPTCKQLSLEQEQRKHQPGYTVLSALLSVLFIILALSTANLVFYIAIPVVWVWYACGYCVQFLAWKKGYNISFGWGYWLGLMALLCWGFIPVEPTMQANILALSHQIPANNMQKPPQPKPATTQNPAQPTPVETGLCAGCGAQLKPNAAFCAKCGMPVK